MIWYKFHIGDYISHTMHLDDAEDLAYRRLLDWYYMSEKPLPLDVALVARRIRLDEEVVTPVLEEFFEKNTNGYINPRADKEIASYNARVELNRKSAKLGGRPKTIVDSVMEPISPPKQNRYRTDTEQNINTDANASMSGTSFPPCPHKELLKLYQKHLPHLTQPRVWEGSRQSTMRARWVQASKPSTYSPKGYGTLEDGLEWWDSFFGYIANDTSLAKGFESNGRTWLPDLVWIIDATNFAKIIDGKYTK
jgi:uncharacterized protein YdaU (DUF1376 family)